MFLYRKIESEIPNVCVNYKNFVGDLNQNDSILIDDGDIKVTVKEKFQDYLLCQVENSGIIKITRA